MCAVQLAFFTTPFDVAKTRLMTQVKSVGEKTNDFYYRGTFDCLKRVYLEEGWRALFAGVGPRVMWISLGGAAFFTAYEFVRNTFSKVLDDNHIK